MGAADERGVAMEEGKVIDILPYLLSQDGSTEEKEKENERGARVVELPLYNLLLFPQNPEMNTLQITDAPYEYLKNEIFLPIVEVYKSLANKKYGSEIFWKILERGAIRKSDIILLYSPLIPMMKMQEYVLIQGDRILGYSRISKINKAEYMGYHPAQFNNIVKSWIEDKYSFSLAHGFDKGIFGILYGLDMHYKKTK